MSNSTGATYYQLRRAAEGRNRWRGLVVNIAHEMTLSSVGNTKCSDQLQKLNTPPQRGAVPLQRLFAWHCRVHSLPGSFVKPGLHSYVMFAKNESSEMMACALATGARGPHFTTIMDTEKQHHTCMLKHRETSTTIIN